MRQSRENQITHISEIIFNKFFFVTSDAKLKCFIGFYLWNSKQNNSPQSSLYLKVYDNDVFCRCMITMYLQVYDYDVFYRFMITMYLQVYNHNVFTGLWLRCIIGGRLSWRSCPPPTAAWGGDDDANLEDDDDQANLEDSDDYIDVLEWFRWWWWWLGQVLWWF